MAVTAARVNKFFVEEHAYAHAKQQSDEAHGQQDIANPARRSERSGRLATVASGVMIAPSLRAFDMSYS